MKKTIFTLLMAGAVLLTMSACKKEVGPKGDKGDPGVAGVQGPQGEPGFAGVKTKQVILAFGPSTYQHDVDISDINPNYLTNVVLVYAITKIGNLDVWTPLPLQVTSNVRFEYSISSMISNQIFIRFVKNDGSPYFLPSNSNQSFKIVAIPVSTIQANPDVDLNDYQAVQAAFLGEE